MGDLLVGKSSKRYTHEELYKFLAVVNDHLYQLDWLLANAEEINQVISHSLNQGQLYHYAVSTLINVLPVMLMRSDFTAWRNRLIDSLVNAQELGDHDLIAKVSIAIARYHSTVGNIHAAQVAAFQAQEYTTQDSDASIQLEAYASLIETYIMRPSRNFKPEMFDEALALSEQSGSDELKAMLHQMVSVASIHQHDFEKAERHAARSLELAEKMRDLAMTFRSSLIYASIQRHLSNWDAVKASLERASALWNNYPAAYQTQRNDLLLCYELANLHHANGDLQLAVDTYLKGLNRLTGSADAYEVGLCRTGLTLVYIAMERFEEARHSLRLTKPIWDKIGNAYMIAHTLYTEAYIEFKSGQDPAYTRTLLLRALEATPAISHEKARESLAVAIQENIDELPPEAMCAM